MATPETSPGDGFDSAAAQFGKIASFLASPDALSMDHAEVENRLWSDGMEMLRLFYQEHFELRECREARLDGVADAQGVEHAGIETKQREGPGEPLRHRGH